MTVPEHRTGIAAWPRRLEWGILLVCLGVSPVDLRDGRSLSNNGPWGASPWARKNRSKESIVLSITAGW
jgi:hypothetical protein